MKLSPYDLAAEDAPRLARPASPKAIELLSDEQAALVLALPKEGLL